VLETVNRKVLVTGAGGFVGRALCNHLVDRCDANVIALVRHDCTTGLDPRVRQVVVDLNSQKIPPELLSGVSTVVHLAAIAHQQNRNESPEQANVRMSKHLLDNMKETSVERLVFMSSIAVVGAGGGSPDNPLDELAIPAPKTGYGRSKLACEELIQKELAETAISWTIIRPPVIYGPSAKGSFGQLLRLVLSGYPLPFAGLSNGRTMVSLANLIELVLFCLWRPEAKQQIFHACDNETLSIIELVHLLERFKGRKFSRAFPVPSQMLRILARLAGRTEALEQLMQPLWLSNSKALNIMGWKPPETVEQGLRRCIEPEKVS